jgi:hypothetical protein
MYWNRFVIRYCLKSVFLLTLLALFTHVYAQSVNNSALETTEQNLQAAELLQESAAETPRNSLELLPFGARLFRGGFSNDREDGLNPNYLIQPGDRISVRIWGATQFNESLVVDHQGNIFVPTVGPILVKASVIVT